MEIDIINLSAVAEFAQKDLSNDKVEDEIFLIEIDENHLKSSFAKYTAIKMM